MVKNLPAMQETWVQSLDWDDPLEKGMAIHTPVSLPGPFHAQRGLVGYSSGVTESETPLSNYHFQCVTGLRTDGQ